MQYGYEFGKGLFAGLKGQITDIIDLIRNPADVVQGLIALGKAFLDDPKGTLKILGELLGQAAVNTITRSTQCGAYDLGKVIGSYVSPAVMLKLATRLGKYSGTLAKAVKDTKVELGCASFVAGTLVLTPTGAVPIEQIAQNRSVLSRNDKLWSESPQTVETTFGRVAPSYRELTTESETFRLTDEHPLWVQGKGWTEARNITGEDVLAGRQGDVLVISNTAIDKPVRVYNFSVAQTPNYFVGESGLWAHNAKCDLHMPYKAAKSPSGYALGASDGGPGKWAAINRDDTPAFRYEKQVTGSPKGIEYEVNGIKFDGYDPKTNVLIDAKNYTANNPLVKGFPPQAIDGIRSDLIKQAKDQIAASGGNSIEWHISNQKAIDAVREILNSTPEISGEIKLVFTPDIVN